MHHVKDVREVGSRGGPAPTVHNSPRTPVSVHRPEVTRVHMSMFLKAAVGMGREWNG